MININNRSEGESIGTAMFGLGLADWVYRKNVNFGKGVSSSITFPMLITIRLVIMIPLFGLLYLVNLRSNVL